MHQYNKDNTFFLARNAYFLVGLGYVAYNFVGTMNKVAENRIVVSMTEHEYQRFTFPSITFCYPFNPQVGKDVRKIVENYKAKVQNDPGIL